MSTTLSNSGSITYNYEGSRDTERQVSNNVDTILQDQCSIGISALALTNTFTNSANIPFVVEISNNGSGELINPTLTVSGADSAYLEYFEGSAIIYRNEETSSILPSSTSPLEFTLPNLQPGEEVVISFVERVISSTPISVDELNIEFTVNATGCNNSNCTATDTVTIIRESSANVSITKAVSDSTVQVGVPFSYIFTLSNSGTLEAQNIVLTDVLPERFVITNITVTINGVSTTYTSDMYNLDTTTNTLTLPNASGQSIIVPPATDTGYGVTTIIITGYISQQ